jgi:hypothetical protein
VSSVQGEPGPSGDDKRELEERGRHRQREVVACTATTLLEVRKHEGGW